MSLSPAKAVSFPLTLVAAGLFAIGGSVAANQDEDQKAEAKDKPPAKAGAEPELDQSRDRRLQSAVDRAGMVRDRQEIARLSVAVANSEQDPRTQATLEALDQPFMLQLDEDATLADLVDQIKESLTTADGKKVPVYVDPRGIEEAGADVDSPVAIDLEEVPLKLSLRLALKQLNLAYCVRQGVVIISSLDGVLLELKEAEGELMGLHPDQVIIGPGGPSFMGTTGRGGRGFQ